jgi:hypothetical protein
MFFCTLLFVGVAWADDVGSVAIRVAEKGAEAPLPCRIHVRNAEGKPQRAGMLPFWFDHFVCPGEVRFDLLPGVYTYDIERGPEYAQARGEFSIRRGETASVPVSLERLVDLSADGWWSGELHVHRPPADIELLMRAEDLHVAPVITWWNNRKFFRSVWQGDAKAPDEPLVRFDGNRYYQLMAGEDERTGGALLYFNLRRPLEFGTSDPEYPSPLVFVAQARKKPGVWIDIEKPFWWDAPLWLASGQADSLGIANNHMHRSGVGDAEAWGKQRDRDRYPPPRGNGLWTQDIYYHALNCGLRIPPSAGSASGVLPNPVGYNRIYAQIDGDFTYDKWWDALRAGRTFVTNGPLLRVTAEGHLPGHVFQATAGKAAEIELKAALTSRDPLRAIEIVRDGRVVATVPADEWQKTGSLGKLRFTESGWFLVRAIADVPNTLRFASTAPFYVEVGGVKSRISKSSVNFFLAWLSERRALLNIEDPAHLRDVLAYHDQARDFFQRLLAQANAE